MRLVIHARLLSNEPSSQTIVGEFDERGGTIGRSDSNTMALPDPERHVSRLQAEIVCVRGLFSIRNVGSSNPIVVNGKTVSPGEASDLQDGLSMVIGGYELHVTLSDGRQHAVLGEPASRPADVRTVIGASVAEGKTYPPRRRAAAAAEDPFADLLGAPATAMDPFAGLLHGSQEPSIPRAVRGPNAAARPSARPSSAVARLPDDFDPFAELSPPLPADSFDQPEPHDPSLGELVGSKESAPGHLDVLFGLDQPALGEDPLQSFLGHDAASGPSPSADPMRLLDRPTVPDAQPPSADNTPQLRSAYRPPPVRNATSKDVDQPSSLPAATPSPAQFPPSGGTSPDELWAALCEGAQIELTQRQQLTPELMRVLGSTLRHAVEGTIQLNAVRTTAKQELHVQVTTIRSKNNNPLKFAPDASAALTQLLQPPLRGFMAAPEAMQDAMADLLGHAVGTMAGTRAAIEGLLDRFEPARLESQLSRGGMLEALVPMNRCARLWELYLQHYGRISESAREDFQELFGKAFVKAYEEQAGQVSESRRPRR